MDRVTEEEREGWWPGILFCTLVVAVMLSGGNALTELYWKATRSFGLVSYELPMQMVTPNLGNAERIGRCQSDVILARVEVYVSEDQGKNVSGRFYNDQHAIILTWRDVGTVAHEVSHFVDQLVYEKGIEDGERRVATRFVMSSARVCAPLFLSSTLSSASVSLESGYMLEMLRSRRGL
jgi:hypothetical protein